MTENPSTPASWESIPPGQDIRLVVTDMDGTLLDADGALPEGFWQLHRELTRRGIAFVPASGRQYAALEREFGDAGAMSFIAENGNLVIHHGRVLSTASMPPATVRDVVESTRNAARAENLGAVVCGLKSAYIERTDAAFVAEARKYYAELKSVPDLLDVTDTVLKLAVYDFDGAEQAAAGTFAHLKNSAQVVVSGAYWVDIMSLGVDKGVGVRALQDALGVTAAQTAVFGDYLNDLQMLSAGDYSFAMANAHADIKAAAGYLAPANTENGVLRVLQRLLAQS